VSAIVGTDPYPFGVTYAFDRVWVTSHDGNSVNAIDPDAGQVVRTVGLSVQPGAVVAGGDSIWVQSRTDATIARIDPATYEMTTITLNETDDLTCDIAFAHGLIWAASVGEREGDATIFEIDPATSSVVAEVPVKGFPCGWVSRGEAEWTATDEGLLELQPRHDTARFVPVKELRWGGWLATADGKFFAVSTDGTLGSIVYRLTPAGKVTGQLHRATDALGIVHVEDPGIWLTSFGTDDVLVMDPETMKMTAKGTLDTGEVVPDTTMGLDQLWLPDASRTAVVHIDPADFLQPAA
jgi:streptogramin lyase